ncbi:O-antigen polymerase [Mucilaginibacter sp. HD30]
MEYHDYLNGMLRINNWLLLINSILIVHFFVSWYLSSLKTGWTIDFWHVTLFLSYFVTFLLMYPFASANLNALVIGNRNLQFAQQSITLAYCISLVGYFSIFVGGTVFKYYNNNTLIYGFLIRPVKITLGSLYKDISINRKTSRFVTFFYFLALFAALLFAYRGGKLNDPRGYYAHNNQFLFLFNFVNSLSGIVSGFLIARIFQFNKVIDKLLFALFIAATLFIGSRGGIIGPLLGYFTSLVYFKMKGKVNMLKVSFFLAGMLCLILVLSFLRAGEFSMEVMMSAFFVQIFYGNTFSDLRDFSWVLSVWNGQYFYGKTYLAAFISFIPSSVSAFRSEWSIGKVTAIMAGYSPKEHPGIRPGMFGESFLNFGIIGVVILGILLGYTWRYIDFKIKEAAFTGNYIEATIAGVACMIISALPITAGFFSIYVNIVVFILLYILRLFFITYKRHAV